MEKKTIIEYLGNSLFTYDKCESIPIDDFIEALTNAKKLGATDVEIEVDVSWGSEEVDGTTITPFYTRQETDEEFKKRADDDKRRQEYYDTLNREEERRKYLQLKQKFEPNA